MKDTSENILIVDDEDGILELMSETVDRWGYNAVIAHNGVEALEKAKTHAIDLILTDFKMPNKNGVELVREIKDIYPETSAIMFTGYAGIDNARDAFKAGVTDYLVKPVDLAELHGKIEDALQERRGYQSKNVLRSVNWALIISIPFWLILAIILSLTF